MYFDEASVETVEQQSEKNFPCENRAKKIHERALGLVDDDTQNLPCEELLVKGNSASTDHKIFKFFPQKFLKQNKGFHQKSLQICFNS